MPPPVIVKRTSSPRKGPRSRVLRRKSPEDAKWHLIAKKEPSVREEKKGWKNSCCWGREERGGPRDWGCLTVVAAAAATENCKNSFVPSAPFANNGIDPGL